MSAAPMRGLHSNPGAPASGRWLVLITLSLCLVVFSLDDLIVNVALPSVQRSFGASLGQLQWTVDAYALVFGALLLFSGGLADRYGRKPVLLAGFATFGVASVAAAYAPTMGALIAARAAMGLGAALVMPATLALIKDVFPAETQGRAVGVWTAMAAVGLPLGPLVGGLLLDHFWWGSVFLINVPVVIFDFVACLVLLPGSEVRRKRPLDVGGAVLATVALGAVVYGLIEAPRNSWTHPATVSWLAGGVVLAVGFVAFEGHAVHPMLPIALLRDRCVVPPMIALACLAFGLYGGAFAATQYLQTYLGLRPLQAGLRMAALAVIALAAPIGASLSERIGMRLVVFVGLGLASAGAFLLSSMGAGDGTLVVLPFLLVGLGAGLTTPSPSATVLRATPLDRAGAGSALTDVSLQVGGALGVAALGSVLTSSYGAAISASVGLPTPVLHTMHDSLGAALASTAGLSEPLKRVAIASARGAFVSGFATTMRVGAAVLAGGAVLALLALPAAEPRNRVAGVCRSAGGLVSDLDKQPAEVAPSD